MIDDRWARVKALFQAAVALPAGDRNAFLDGVAADDASVRGEVETLLAADEADVAFLDRLPVAAEEVLAGAQAHVSLSPGRQVGGYEVVELLGAGAMGEVYRARDATLNRDVALKVLPAVFAIDSARLARFRREAQVLAALNHPNIAAIHGFEESDGVHALVLELVEGPTLADVIARGVLPLAQVLAIARQIADALEAAHDQGIVHRDLKPSNIKVRPDDVVKVLDFGLAKALAPDETRAGDEGDRRVAGTNDGIILGTAAYMPPEQARGEIVDRRADIWAFGCVVFELLSRKPAFRGETFADVIAAVTNTDPDWTLLPRDVPPAVRTLLQRCLSKHPRQRLQAIGDARLEIEAAEGALRDRIGAAGVNRVRGARMTRWLPSLALGGLVAAIVWTLRLTPAQADPFADAQFTRITDWDGAEGGAEISPDGKLVAFLGDRDGEYDIWLSQIGTGVFRNLTPDFPPLQPIGATFRKFGFSGDGSEIWFSPDTGPAMGQLIMPALGGPPRAFLERGATAPAWSPDGSRVVYFKNDDGDPLWVADRTGADARVILTETGMHTHNPVWSRDGRWIYVARGSDPTEQMNVWRVRPSGESLEQLTNDATAVNFMTPLDNRTLVYVARAPDHSGPSLWMLDVERKTTRRVSAGLGPYTSVSASQDGRRVVATIAKPTSSLWRVPLGSAQAEEHDVRPFAVPSTRALAPRFAGRSLYYLSTTSAGDGLWLFRDGNAQPLSKAADGGLFEPPAVAPGGDRVAIVVRRAGKRRLLLVSADGRRSATLAPEIEVEGAAGQSAADWSPDGGWIVVGGRDASGPGLFKIGVDTGMVVRLVTGQAANPLWAPDGNMIVYAGRFFTGQVELLGVRPDGTRVDVPVVRARPGGYRFLRAGGAIVYLPVIPSLDFWLFDFASGESRQITRLDNHGMIGTFDVTPDGQAIVFDRAHENSDVVLIELGR